MQFFLKENNPFLLKQTIKKDKKLHLNARNKFIDQKTLILAFKNKVDTE